jgi:serine/threonine protein kinase
MIEPSTLLQNRYRVSKQIGQGGMGAVYVATDERFRSTVAVKQTFFDDPALRQAFEREAQLLNRLRHTALPRVSDHFTEGNGQFLVMEFIEGADVSELLHSRGGGLPVSDVLRWADELLDALDYLHTQDPAVIHRDIKPQNLKLTPRNQIILLDFGLAKGQSEHTRASEMASVFGYSRNYAPLEQIQGTGTDARSDIYSLAATIYHLITGQAPVDALTRVSAIVKNQPDPLRFAHQICPHVPAAVGGILHRAMTLNLAQRPRTAAEMRASLRQAAGGLITPHQPSAITGYTQENQLRRKRLWLTTSPNLWKRDTSPQTRMLISATQRNCGTSRFHTLTRQSWMRHKSHRDARTKFTSRRHHSIRPRKLPASRTLNRLSPQP